jgi:rhamnulose-1-phosphate aldolase
MKKDPMHTVGIIEIDETGEQYRICWGLLDGGKPTSEMPTHLMNLEVRKNMTNSEERVIYHAHCPNLIALTFLLPLKDEVFTRELWEMMTECPVIFPEGVGVVKWMVPGGKDIAVATSKKMENYRAVIWAHHGLFCSGIDFDSTFGLMHTIEKSAEIYIKVHSVQTKKAQSITPDDFRQLAKEFHVTLNERFLYEK